MKKLALILFSVFFSLIEINAQDVTLLKDINPSGSIDPREPTICNGKLFFIVFNNNKFDLWVTDGTADGTHLVKQIHPTSNGTIEYLYSYDNILLFSADDGTYGRELWISDGTESGTQLLKDINPTGGSYSYGFIEMNNKVYFGANDGIHGDELWVTDGTTAGTQMVKDINPSGESNPQIFIVYNNKLYFVADDGTHGDELWVTDGTESGTEMLKDINSTGSIVVNEMIIFQNKMYLSLDAGSYGAELWVSDGTASGTQLLKDINPSGEGYPAGFIVYDNKIFFSADDGVHGRELWATDGTTNGTYMVYDVDPATNPTASSYPAYFTILNGKLYFSADATIFGQELWGTDGTDEGTIIVEDLKTGLGANGWVQKLNMYNNRLYFVGEETEDNFQLWCYDDVLDTVYSVAPDIAPLSDPTLYSSFFCVYNGSFYYEAEYSSVGNEIWKLTTQAPEIIDDNNDLEITVFPNPASQYITIKSPEKIYNVEILNLNGQIILSTTQLENIDIGDLCQGLYFIKINAEKRTVVEKIVIQ